MDSRSETTTRGGSRRYRTVRRALLVCLGCGLVVAACSLPPKHEYQLAPGQSYDASLRTVLLIPINETEEIPNKLEKGEAAIFGIIREYLQAQGLTVETPAVEKFRRAGRIALRRARRGAMSPTGNRVSGEAELTDVVHGIVDGLKSKADLVVVPNMVIRGGELVGRSLRWDGVRRRIESTERMGGWSGTGSGASLQVAVYRADGTHVFSGYGGLDLLWRANIQVRKMELVEDRLEDESNLREGVCVAFYPYFGEDKACRGLP